MGCYEREQQAIAAGTGERGQAMREYFAELDAELTEETAHLSHRPEYKALLKPENDDIYREFCAYIDQPAPRVFDFIENPITIEGYNVADIYKSMITKNSRIVTIDGAAAYNMLVKLREQPMVAIKLIEHQNTCYQGGCGSPDEGFRMGLYD